jgi:hypothetical protein
VLIEWKIPCELCGERDVEILAAWPAENHPLGHSHETVVVHWNGDRCYPLRRRVVVTAAQPREPRRAFRAALPAARAAARRRRLEE